MASYAFGLSEQEAKRILGRSKLLSSAEKQPLTLDDPDHDGKKVVAAMGSAGQIVRSSVTLDRATGLVARGDNCYKQGDYRAAEKLLHGALYHDKEHFDALMTMCATQIKLGRPKQARVCWRKARDLRPKGPHMTEYDYWLTRKGA